MPDQLIILVPLLVAVLLYFDIRAYLKIRKMGQIVLKVQDLKLVTMIVIIIVNVLCTGVMIFILNFFYTKALQASEFLRGTEIIQGIEDTPDYVTHIGYISFIMYYIGKLIISSVKAFEKDSIRERGLVKGGRGYLWNEITKYEWVENKIKVTATPASLFKLNDNTKFEIAILPQYKEDVENILKNNISNEI